MASATLQPAENSVKGDAKQVAHVQGRRNCCGTVVPNRQRKAVGWSLFDRLAAALMSMRPDFDFIEAGMRNRPTDAGARRP